MNRLLLIALVTLALSCSKDDNDCKCNAKYMIFGQSGYFYVNNQPIDCETRQPSEPLQGQNPNAVFVECAD